MMNGIKMKLALMIVDMIDEFVTGKFGSPRAEATVPKIKELIAKARSENIPVVYLHDAHKEGDPEIDIWGEHAMDGTDASEIVTDLKPETDDLVIKKQVYSGFYKSDLENILRSKGIDTLIVTGVSTDICVQHNIADAFYSGFKTYVVTDGTAAIDSDTHEGALNYISKMYSTGLMDAKEAIEIMENAG